MYKDLKTIEWFPEGSNIVFYGYPGSGRTNAFVKIAAKLKRDFEMPITIVNCDKYHLGKDGILKAFASILEVPFYQMDIGKLADVQYDNLFIYLHFDERGCLSKENKPFVSLNLEYIFKKLIFQNKNFKKVLVLDCTRKAGLNDALIESIGKEFIDAIILTKIDMVADKNTV